MHLEQANGHCGLNQQIYVMHAAARLLAGHECIATALLTLPVRRQHCRIQQLLQQLLHGCRPIVSTEPFCDGYLAEFNNLSAARIRQSVRLNRGTPQYAGTNSHTVHGQWGSMHHTTVTFMHCRVPGWVLTLGSARHWPCVPWPHRQTQDLGFSQRAKPAAMRYVLANICIPFPSQRRT